MGWVSISRIRLQPWNLWIGTIIIVPNIYWVLWTGIDWSPSYVWAHLILSIILRGRLLLSIFNKWGNWTEAQRDEVLCLHDVIQVANGWSRIWTRWSGWSGFLTTAPYILLGRNKEYIDDLYPFLYFAHVYFVGQGLLKIKFWAAGRVESTNILEVWRWGLRKQATSMVAGLRSTIVGAARRVCVFLSLVCVRQCVIESLPSGWSSRCVCLSHRGIVVSFAIFVWLTLLKRRTSSHLMVIRYWYPCLEAHPALLTAQLPG